MQKLFRKFTKTAVINSLVVIFQINVVHAAITVTEDEPRGGVTCFKITTASATYYYDKDGGGLASMVDKEGKDWIGFDKNKSQADGFWRGIPNAVHEQDISCFHPLNSSTQTSVTTLISKSNDKVTLESTSGKWKCQWNFYETYCTFTMLTMTSGMKYWVLYEGTPYGKSEKDNSWFYNSKGEKSIASQTVPGDLPDPEWVAFGHNQSPRTLLLINNTDNTETDHYYWLGSMTVFGFGRGTASGTKYIANVPRTFSFAFVESTDYETIKTAALSIVNGTPTVVNNGNKFINMNKIHSSSEIKKVFSSGAPVSSSAKEALFINGRLLSSPVLGANICIEVPCQKK